MTYIFEGLILQNKAIKLGKYTQTYTHKSKGKNFRPLSHPDKLKRQAV